jgi:hypothetical protein
LQHYHPAVEECHHCRPISAPLVQWQATLKALLRIVYSCRLQFSITVWDVISIVMPTSWIEMFLFSKIWPNMVSVLTFSVRICLRFFL